MDITDTVEKDRKSAKICGSIATIIYIPLFPILVMLAGASALVFDNPGLSIPLGLSIILLYLITALSVPFTLYRIWSCYSRDEYRKSRFSCLIPIAALLITSAYHTSVQLIELFLDMNLSQ